MYEGKYKREYIDKIFENIDNEKFRSKLIEKIREYGEKNKKNNIYEGIIKLLSSDVTTVYYGGALLLSKIMEERKLKRIIKEILNCN